MNAALLRAIHFAASQALSRVSITPITPATTGAQRKTALCASAISHASTTASANRRASSPLCCASDSTNGDQSLAAVNLIRLNVHPFTPCSSLPSASRMGSVAPRPTL